jgi:aminoglycoside phosphotransferase family enzyme
MLPNRLARGAVDAPLLQRIARRLARFHAAAATGPGVDEFGSLDTIHTNWDENFRQTQPFVGRTLPPDRQDRIRTFVEQFLREHAELLERRVAAGRVRDGHGDLHLASICVEGHRLHLFDCVEFAPRFRCADVAAEVAFLAMDLDHHARADLAHAFVDAHVQATGDGCPVAFPAAGHGAKRRIVPRRRPDSAASTRAAAIAWITSAVRLSP